MRGWRGGGWGGEVVVVRTWSARVGEGGGVEMVTVKWGICGVGVMGDG